MIVPVPCDFPAIEEKPKITCIPWILQEFLCAYGIFQYIGKVKSIDFVRNVAGMRLKRLPFKV